MKAKFQIPKAKPKIQVVLSRDPILVADTAKRAQQLLHPTDSKGKKFTVKKVTAGPEKEIWHAGTLKDSRYSSVLHRHNTKYYILALRNLSFVTMLVLFSLDGV